jgi:putative permease
MMKRLAWVITVILATITMALLMVEFRSAVILFVLSLVIAATVRPLVDWFAARGLPRGLALLLTYVACIGLMIALSLIVSGLLFTDFKQLTTDITQGYEQLRSEWPTKGTLFQQNLARQLPAASDLYTAITGRQGGALLQTGLGLTLGFFDLISQLLIILVLSIYWSADQEHFKRTWLSLLPFELRASARETWQTIEAGLGAYLRSQLMQSLLALILLGIGYQVLGLNYPIALAFIGAIGWLIPWVGLLLAVIPATLVGLSISPVLAIVTALLTIGVLSFLEFVVEPRLFNRRRFSSLLVVVAVLVLVDQYGLIGILIAPPLAAVIQILASQLIRSTKRPVMPQLAQPIDVLQARLESVQALLAAQNGSSSLEMTNLVDRLTKLIARASDG